MLLSPSVNGNITNINYFEVDGWWATGLKIEIVEVVGSTFTIKNEVASYAFRCLQSCVCTQHGCPC